jgi:hypothetical protein
MRMHTLRHVLIGAALSIAALMAIPAVADTQNYGLGPQQQIIPFHISGQYTATTASVVRFKLPYPVKLVGVSATARASGGTTPTLAIDVKEAGNTVLSAPVAITAGTVSEGTVTDSLLADESTITADLTIGGTSPTWNDIVLLLTVVRR